MTIEPRPVLGSLPPYVAGQSLERLQAELGVDRVVNLATNETQFGPFPAAAEVIRRHAGEAHRYPELDGELTERIAAAHGVLGVAGGPRKRCRRDHRLPVHRLPGAAVPTP